MDSGPYLGVPGEVLAPVWCYKVPHSGQPCHPWGSSCHHPGTQDPSGLPGRVNLLLLVTLRFQGWWEAVPMETVDLPRTHAGN